MNEDAREGRYPLGHSERELERLATQARLIDPITRRHFLEAGLASGMRVLDVGSGAGDVAILAASIVGESGEVVGTDRSAVALETARARAAVLSLRNVRFLEGDPADTSFDQPFDAVVGRYVLMFQPDPAAMLGKLKAHLGLGGLIVFHEPDWASAGSFPPAPIYDECCRWIAETLRRLGIDERTGTHLHAAFLEAGLPAPSMRLESVIGSAVTSLDGLRLKADLAITMLNDIERTGVASAAEVGAETLLKRMTDEALANGSVTISRAEIGAWARVD